MHVTVTTLPKAQATLEIALTAKEFEPFLHRAAEALSREHKVPGFRPGKLPYDMAVQRFGADAIRDEAIEPAVRDAYVRAVREQGVKTVGSPKIALEPATPVAALVFTATVSVLPEVTLPDFATIAVEKRAVVVTPDQVAKVLDDLRKMQPKEALTDAPAAETDKVIVDLDLTKDNVPVDGGQARDHQIYLTESYYLPKVKEALVGMKKGDIKTLALEFPKDHFQKHLAGSTVDAKVVVKDVYAVELPPLDDAFAKALGAADLAGLRAIVEKNLTDEAAKKASDAEEISMLEAAIGAAKFAELPELLITGEARSMLEELERGVTNQGMEFEEYLKRVKQSRDTLLLSFAPDAVKRVKVALLTHAVAEREAIVAEEDSVEEEIRAQLERYQNEPAFHDRLRSEEAREYVRSALRNRKVIAWMRGRVTWK